ncbi:hypothetical protein F3Y22_tig00110987pilonHSYRG00256 [Hibiscus syriacus]|uniref:Ubiquitin-like domain-containing protein n=1 Tax=Hibiscus syriacus TaxID=106335 RepID=A0A6A2Z9L8_HIBSY|nr:hypothetical protein F3Y22_tig00110987pilonHSYRG00256 [Hibiscus syriacus]
MIPLIPIYLKVVKTEALKVKSNESDDERLVDHGIQRNSTLHLVLRNFDRVKLLVKIPSQKRTLVVEARAHDTVRSIKSLIEAKEGIEFDRFLLVYDGKLLENADTHILKVVKTEALKVKPNEPQLSYLGQQLEDSKTLACYDIKEESMLEMLLPLFQIFVNPGLWHPERLHYSYDIGTLIDHQAYEDWYLIENGYSASAFLRVPSDPPHLFDFFSDIFKMLVLHEKIIWWHDLNVGA